MTKPKTNAQKRVAICRDVIKQLDAKRIIAESGTYLAPRSNKNGSQYRQLVNQETLTGDKPPVCRVCALGAVFLSRVRLFDDYNGFIVHTGSYEMTRSLHHIFGRRRLSSIEQMFECGGPVDLFNRLGDEVRLRFICRFIIRAQGEFKVAAFNKSAARFAARQK